ncbi:uncharacterized protein BcabD6B2_31530 [Babesia caballi]|uniref:Membrane protein, putative n=1 Tax=Babesia caballi TaxID=5871 RepID=A0AAV4LU69_BABCB|nr:membrane protein, putative [Babesia caballi]
MRFWLLLLTSCSAYVAAFHHARNASPAPSLTAGFPGRALRAKSLLDDPLLLAPSAEPGKDHEVVVSDSPAFGLQRVLYTHRRRVRSRGPLFAPGDCVYLVSGPYRNARGTVLSTFRSATGQPHLVSVVLDCRNERGIVRHALSSFHGCRVTVRESQLATKPVFAPYSPPAYPVEDSTGLDRGGGSRPHRASHSPLLRVLVSRITNSTRVPELRALFDSISQLDLDDAAPYCSLTVQLARSLEMKEDGAAPRSLVDAVLSRLHSALQADYSERLRASIPWLAWALHVFRRRRAVSDLQTMDDVYNDLGKIVLSGKLKDLTQPEIAHLATGFRNVPHLRKRMLHWLALVYSYVPPNTVHVRSVATVAYALTHARVSHWGFSRLLRDFVTGEYEVIPPEAALCILEYLNADPETPQRVKDLLLACCSAADFLKPTASPAGPLYVHALRLARLSERDMSDCLHAIKSGECQLPSSVTMNSLFAIPLGPSTAELLRLFVMQLTSRFGELTSPQRLHLLNVARRLTNCPVELVDALDLYLRGLAKDFVLDHKAAMALAQFLPRIPDARQGTQMLVLEHLERFITFTLSLLRDRALDESTAKNVMRQATACLRSIPLLGYELPSFAHTSAALLREGLPHAPSRLSVLLGMMSVHAMCPSYFETASEAARKLLEDPCTNLTAEDAPLAELLLLVKKAVEGADSLGPTSERLHSLHLPTLRPEAAGDVNWGYVKQFSVLFSLLARSRLMSNRGEALSAAYVFAEDNIGSLSSTDLLLLRDALVSLDAFDAKWEGLMASVPKGIDAVT